MKTFELVPFGEKTLILRFDDVQEQPETIHWLNGFAAFLRSKYSKTFEDVLLSHLEINLVSKKNTDFKKVEKQVRLALTEYNNIDVDTACVWEIPACFDAECAPDLDELFGGDQNKIDTYIQAFTAQELYVHFFGFLPGFAYLGGLPKELQMPRKAHPRLAVPKGAVAVGGSYAAVYPQQSPGGWQLIGQTPFVFFDRNRMIPFFLKPGDRIRFKPISFLEYQQLDRDYKKASFLPQKIENK